MAHGTAAFLAAVFGVATAVGAPTPDPPHPVLKWVKHHPREGAAKPSPRLGY